MGYPQLKKWVLENIYFESRHERRDYFETFLEINSNFCQKKAENQFRTVYKKLLKDFFIYAKIGITILYNFVHSPFPINVPLTFFFMKSKCYCKFTTNNFLAKFAQKELF